MKTDSKYSFLLSRNFFSAYEIACVHFNEDLYDNEEPIDSSYLNSKNDSFLKFMLHLLESKSDYTIDFYTFKSDSRIFSPLFTSKEISKWYKSKPKMDCPAEFFIQTKKNDTIEEQSSDTKKEDKKQSNSQQRKGSPSASDIPRIKALEKKITNLSASLQQKYKINLPNKAEKIVIPLTPDQLSNLLLTFDYRLFSLLKTGAISNKTFWKTQKKYILASHRELNKEDFKKIQQAIISL